MRRRPVARHLEEVIQAEDGIVNVQGRQLIADAGQ